MSRREVATMALAFFAAAGCRKAQTTVMAIARIPKGDVVWIFDPAAQADPSLDGQLSRLGAVALFLPAGTLGTTGLRVAPVAPKPFEHVPVVLVFGADDALADSFANGDGPQGDALTGALTPALSEAITGGAYGRVAGVHLDFPFTPRSAARYADLVRALKRGLPSGTFVSISLRSLPSTEEDRKKISRLLEVADALAAFVFGPGERVDPTATDALKRPWWAVYDTRAVGQIVGRDGAVRATVPARLVEPLSGNGRFEFENDLSSNDASVSAYTLTARQPVRVEGVEFAAGDRIAFRLPAISEMIFQLGSNLAGKRYALGRALIFDGATEADRVFDLAAFEDVVLGRSLAPVLEASLKPAGRNAVAVELVNRSHHASVVSRVDNWVEVDLSPAHPADVQIGGFDRYEVYDREGRPVTPGRATVVRLFETLIGPMETITPARIVAHGPLPAGCCRYRLHAVSAVGPEVATDWSAPPPPPTPEPKKKVAATRKAK